MSQLPHYPRLARVFAPIRYHLSRTVPVVALSTLAVTGLLSAWSEPIENPPGGSADAPVNVSTIRQNKRGDLGVENLYLDAVAPEGNIYRAHQIVGYNDLFLRGDSSEFAAIYYSGKEHRFYTKTSVGAAAAERFTINSDGNVGIGAANPGRKLDVAGDANIGQTYLSNSDIYFTNTGHSHTGIGNTAGYAAIENAANYNTLMILGRSGGIGGGRSVSIWDRLDVNGSMYVNGQPPCLQNGANCPATAAEADTLQTVTNRGNTTSNPINVAKLNFNGVGGDSGQGLDYYGIYQEAGSWTHPYPDLRIGYHTGIKLGAHFGYGGTRFYNNSDMVTQIASIGDSDNNVRVYNDLYVGSIGGWASSVLCRSNGTNCPSSGLGGGGTVNYISKFTGSGTLGNSQIFDNGSSVGIGTASPGAGLDVRANAGRIMGNTLYFYGSGNHSDGMPYARLIES
ncbi:MAG: hypothetical protein Q8R13_02165, partial [bacterium]|nr:hypothetical protein [bacterium]